MPHSSPAMALGRALAQRLPGLAEAALVPLVPGLMGLWLGQQEDGEVLSTRAQALVRRQLGVGTQPDGGDGPRRASIPQLMVACRVLRGLMVEAAAQPGPVGPGSVGRAHLLIDATVGLLADASLHEEALLQHSRAQFQLIIDAIPQLVWRTTVNGEATFANRRFLDYVGCSLDEVLGWGWLSVIHPDDRTRVGEEWARCRAAGTAVSVAFRVRDREGAYRWFLSLGNPFCDADGTAVAYYGTWTDFDSHHQLVDTLERALLARDTFLSVASHELKTPLTALKMRTQIRERRLANPALPMEPRERLLAQARHDGESLRSITRLVDDMLDVAQLDRGQLRFADAALDLGRLVADTAERHAPLLAGAGCALRIECEGGLSGQWDPLRLEQAVANLLSNCCRYARGQPVRVGCRRHGAQALIEVQDRGPGIPAEHQARIFGRFERAIAASEQSGLGLGLFLVKTIARRYQGEVRVTSAPGVGSTFVIALPLQAPPRP